MCVPQYKLHNINMLRNDVVGMRDMPRKKLPNMAKMAIIAKCNELDGDYAL